MAAKKVFVTNIDTVNRVACWNRDQHKDGSDFEGMQHSRLYKESYRAGRMVFRQTGLWWEPELVTVTDDGKATVICRFARKYKLNNPYEFQFEEIDFEFCSPDQLTEKIESEKKNLNYWYIPES